MKDHNTAKIGDLIKVFMRRYKLEGRLDEAEIRQLWESIAGNIVARHTESVSLKKKVLVLRLNSAALRHTLSFSKTEFIQKLNDALGKEMIEDIVLK